MLNKKSSSQNNKKITILSFLHVRKYNVHCRQVKVPCLVETVHFTDFNHKSVLSKICIRINTTFMPHIPVFLHEKSQILLNLKLKMKSFPKLIIIYMTKTIGANDFSDFTFTLKRPFRMIISVFIPKVF